MSKHLHLANFYLYNRNLFLIKKSTTGYASGPQTVRRKTLSGAPRKHAKVVVLTAFLTIIAV